MFSVIMSCFKEDDDNLSSFVGFLKIVALEQTMFSIKKKKIHKGLGTSPLERYLRG